MEIQLFVLSEQTSEQIFAFQARVADRLDDIVADQDLLWQMLAAYIPSVLVSLMGRATILGIMNAEELCGPTGTYVALAEGDFIPAMKQLFETR